MATFGKKAPPPPLSPAEQEAENQRVRELLRARMLERIAQEKADSERAELLKSALRMQ